MPQSYTGAIEIDPDHKQIAHCIGQFGTEFSVSPAIIYGICMAESAMNPHAIRYEPNYRWLFDPKKVRPSGCSIATETELQKMSWGLMQVMGAVYREYGFSGWLSEISGNIEAQIYYGCKHLKLLCSKYGAGAPGISAYNAGSPRKDAQGRFINQQYVDKVLSFSRQWC